MPYGYGASKSHSPSGNTGNKGSPHSSGGWSPGVGRSKTGYLTTHPSHGGSSTPPPKKKTTTVTTGGASPFPYTKTPTKGRRTTGITDNDKFRKFIARNKILKKPVIEYFYPSEHCDMYTALQTGKIPTSNYHRDVTADYWKNVSKNWSEVHPALGAIVNVGAPAGTMIGGLMYDLGQAYTRMEPGSGLLGYAKAVAAEQPIKSNLQRMAGSVEPLLSASGLNLADGGLINFYRYGGFV